MAGKLLLFQSENTVSPEVEAEVRDLFTYHKPTDKQIENMENVREAGIQYVLAIIRNVPAGPTRTVAIRKVIESRMDCNSSIIHMGRY